MPRKRKTRAATGANRGRAKIPDGAEADMVEENKAEKLELILQDFDVEIKARLERLEESSKDSIRAVERKLNFELIQIPPIIQKMKLTDFIAQGGIWNTSKEDAELDNYTSKVEEKIKSKTKIALNPIEEESQSNSENSAKGKRPIRKGRAKGPRKAVMAKNQSENCPPPTTGRTRRPPRGVMNKQCTPAHSSNSIPELGAWDTPLETPKFSSRLPCTPAVGLRNMTRGERVTLVSNSGSPVATNESTLIVPIGDQMVMIGESRMDKDTRQIIEKLKQKLRVIGNDVTFQ